jgi:hypothetical protein
MPAPRQRGGHRAGHSVAHGSGHGSGHADDRQLKKSDYFVPAPAPQR